MKDSKKTFTTELAQRGLPYELAKYDHRRFMLPHPTQSTGGWCDSGDVLEIVCRYTGSKPSVGPELWILPVAEFPDSESKPRQVAKLDFGSQLITASSRGVLYFASLNFPTNSDIIVEVISGARPMPRFVLGENTPQEWEQALEDHSDVPYGELVGRRMIVTMPLYVLKKEVDDPSKLTTLWDKIVTHAEDCYGLHSSNSRPHKSTPFQYIFETKPDSTGGSLSASDYWLGTNFDSANCVCNSIYLNATGWGPWHELGHHYQLDDMRWDGMTEVTVNLVSLYVQRELYGRATRLDNEWPKIFEYFQSEEKNFQKIENQFAQVAMFWQLDLTFGKEFYARLGLRYRTIPQHERPKNSDEKVQLFICETSRISGQDLTPFFLMWGIKPTEETRIKLKQMNLYAVLKENIWENTDKDKKHTFSLAMQNISGRVLLPDHIHEGGIFEASVELDYLASPQLDYHWDVPHGFRVLTGQGEKNITLIAPEEIIHNSSVQISVVVSRREQITPDSDIFIPLASNMRLKVTGEKDVYPDQSVDKYVMEKYGVNQLHAWDRSRNGNVGDIYLGAWSDGSREYFKLKSNPYWYFPANQEDNKDWEFLGKYGPQEQYYLDELVCDNVITTRRDLVVGAAESPMSDATFFGRVGAETTDGSEIRLSPRPADCSAPGRYEIMLSSGEDSKYVKTAIYEVHGNDNAPCVAGTTPITNNANETWCGLHQNNNI